MNILLLLTYHAWTKPRRTLHRLIESVGLRAAVVLYAVVTLLFTLPGIFVYPEQSFFDISYSLISRIAAPLILSELAYRLTKRDRLALLHGVLLLYTSSDLLVVIPNFFYTDNLDALPFAFVILLLLIVLWSFGVLILMLSELLQRRNFTAFLLQVVTSSILLSASYLLG